MSGPNSILEIDGKYLEGGGQILRNALSFSCILRRPVRIVNIRANRPNPGLSNQHLFGLNLLVDITGAQVKGNSIKSTEVEICPGKIKAGNYYVNTKTAASISLVLQSALPVLIFGEAPSKLELVGGTNVGMAPQVDFMTEVLRPNLEKFGVTFDFDLIRRGYYPRGGGCCKVQVPAIKFIKSASVVNFGKLHEIRGWCFVAGNLPERLAGAMQQSVSLELQKLNCRLLNIEAYKESPDVAKDNGSGVILLGLTSENCTLGVSKLGEKKIDAEKMGSDAGRNLCNLLLSETCVDEYVQDQLIIYMALAKGNSQIKTLPLTDHTRTAIYVAEKMTGVHFVIEPQGNHVLLSCTGIGYENQN